MSGVIPPVPHMTSCPAQEHLLPPACDDGWYLCEIIALSALRNEKFSIFLLLFTSIFLPVPWVLRALMNEPQKRNKEHVLVKIEKCFCKISNIEFLW